MERTYCPPARWFTTALLLALSPALGCSSPRAPWPEPATTAPDPVALDGGAPVDSAPARSSDGGTAPASSCVGSTQLSYVGSNGKYDAVYTPCAVACLDGACVAADPALEDPARDSAPYECQGATETSAQLLSRFAPGTDELVFNSGRDTDLKGRVLYAYELERTCRPGAPCTAWQKTLDEGAPSEGRDDYIVFAWVAGDGTMQLLQGDSLVAAADGSSSAQSTVLRTMASGDFQVALNAAASDGHARLYRARFTAAPNGAGCFSLASATTRSDPSSDGSYSEQFWLASTNLPAPQAPTAHMPAGPPPPWSGRCQGAPASNATTAAWFEPGASQRLFSDDESFRSSSQSCHPITGCGPWVVSSGTRTSISFPGVATMGTGYALELTLPGTDAIGDVALVDGQASTPSVSGVLTSDGCASFDAVTVTPAAAPSAVVTTRHDEEQNHF